VKIIRPVLDDNVQELGLTRRDVANAIKTSYTGIRAGIFREGEKLVPIVARLPLKERGNVENLEETQIWSSISRRYIPLAQVISSVLVEAEDPMIYRINRMRAITVETDSGSGAAGALFGRLREKIGSIPLPAGVTMEWGGEYENSRKAQGGLMGMIPVAFMVIVVILVALFNGIRQPVIILLCLPLSIMGLSVGLLVMDKSFDFLALLGFLSLAGMLIKNAIVLIDQIDLEIREGKAPFNAILDSGVSRCRPVMMAALTTVLGMVPLYFDVLFSAMAVTIMFGLSFATVLTLVVVPVLYGEALKA
ncbi:MAG: efflux RND transporter permease subunit, partial [Synergistales bacterium]|nr:efflux RND transporter permease subunit [Synergistales bacterium]